jgi:UDP-glucose 4-epimerase
MKILLTGSSGRIGRAIYVRLCREHDVVGYDIAPASTTHIVAPLQDKSGLQKAVEGVDAVIHCAALHAPHVGVATDQAFEEINVTATQTLARLCLRAGVKQMVFTSTTALYGAASTPEGRAAWVTELTEPKPRTIYHWTKLQAEQVLAKAAEAARLQVTAIRMSRCFPEPAPIMAAYRLHRGVDARDVAEAHALALHSTATGFQAFLVSGATPFLESDCEALLHDAPAVIRMRAPALAECFVERGWELPRSIDRVYSSAKAQAELGWSPRHGFGEVLAEMDRRSPEVLPMRTRSNPYRQ